MTPGYPPAPAGPFPEPPRTVADAEDREVRVERASEEDLADLLEMYREFDPADRAQGIPPLREHAIRRWLETVLDPSCLNVAARHDGGVVGHATLVPDDEGAYELAIFVLHEYQGAGIGTALLETLLGLGEAERVDRVWLTVERWNDPAIALYESVGFERREDDRLELEMAIRLSPD